MSFDNLDKPTKKVSYMANLKEKAEFWEEDNTYCEHYHCYYARVEEHQIKKKSSLKSVALQIP